MMGGHFSPLYGGRGRPTLAGGPGSAVDSHCHTLPLRHALSTEPEVTMGFRLV